MRKRIVSRFRMLVGVLIPLLFLLPVGRAQAGYPGASLFTFQCNSTGIIFLLHDTMVLDANFPEIARAIASAISSQQNQPIIIGDPASLWALKSNELQIHLTADPDGTKLVVSSGICGQTFTTTPSFDGEALAYVQLNGPGTAIAIAKVSASGQTFAFAAVSGQGQALALAKSNVPGNQYVYIVQPGDDLYQIAIRFNTTVDALVSLNGLSDANVIYVGQSLRIPA